MLLLITSFCRVGAAAEAPRVLISGQSADTRGENLKTLNGHFPFLVPASLDDWQSRAAALRRRVLVATGLWPMPHKTPLNAVIHGKVERPGFTVEKVYFESLPGHYVTGMLFRPTETAETGASGGLRLPGVLSPHGHGGRLQRYSDRELAAQIAQGAEHFEKSGRMPKLARCAQLARMGCVTFIFDMLGYADSIQISQTIAHRFQQASKQGRSSADSDQWEFYSPQADLRLQSVMGLQTWNAIRSLDFLASLPDVDPDRLAVTGGSGGGTQTILLGAIDDRVKVGFPNGMVSTSMQGGCYCENCNLLRIDTGNVELAALFAPRPQAMTAADDWTKQMMSDGYPELQRLYAMTGDQHDVYCRPMLHFKHNYNYVTRATMYQWFNRHLKLGLDDPVVEQDFEPLTDAEMTVWNDDHPQPTETGIEHERNLCAWFDQQSGQQLAAIEPTDAKTLEEFRGTVGGAWQVIFDQGLPETVSYKRVGSDSRVGLTIEKGLVSAADRQAQLPLLTVYDKPAIRKEVLIWTDGAGKSAAFDSAGEPNELLTRLVAGGTFVMLPDLYHQGELQVAGVAAEDQPLIADDRPYSAFSFGYNRTAVGQRAADLLAIIAHAAADKPNSIRLLGTGDAASWTAAAAARAGGLIDRVAIDFGDFRFADVRSYRDVNFVPGAVKYGDLPVLVALRAPHNMTVIANHQPPAIVKKTYDAAERSDAIDWFQTTDANQSIIDWNQAAQ